MIRGPELEKLLRELRPTYVALVKAETDLKKDEVRQTMRVRVAVEAQAGDARGAIADRARAFDIERDAMLAILGAAHAEQKRLGRRPSALQLIKRIRDRVAGTGKAVPIAEQDALDAAHHAETVRQRHAAWTAACLATTGFPN